MDGLKGFVFSGTNWYPINLAMNEVLVLCPLQSFSLPHTFADPGDHVITEDYTYLSIPTMLNPLGAKYVVVEGDQGGMRPDKLWEGLRKR